MVFRFSPGIDAGVTVQFLCRRAGAESSVLRQEIDFSLFWGLFEGRLGPKSTCFWFFQFVFASSALLYFFRNNGSVLKEVVVCLRLRMGIIKYKARNGRFSWISRNFRTKNGIYNG